MLYDAESGDMTLVVTGDTMITRRLSTFREDRFIELMNLLRQADVGFTNLEMLMHEFEHSPGMAGGTFTGSDPRNLDELKWAGISLVSCANNHSYDYGEGGLLTNLQHLRDSGIAHAGTGRNLSEARSPAYLDTARGRVALISATSTFAEAGRAMDQRPDIKGSPGMNSLRFETTRSVDRTGFDELRRISTELGLEAQKDIDRKFKGSDVVPEDTDTQFQFLGSKFALAEDFSVSTNPNLSDMEGNLKWIREARRMADMVLVSFHCHENGATRDQPPEFLETFARACIEEGADAFLGHGPHVTRGIEIYNGRPIFYSLGNFIFQNETVRWQPAHNYELVKLDHTATPADFYAARSENDTRWFPSDTICWESIAAQCDYRDGKLNQITLYPVDLGHGRPRSQRGRPVMADSEVGSRVLDRMKCLSEPFGTNIRIEDNRGVISLPSS